MTLDPFQEIYSRLGQVHETRQGLERQREALEGEHPGEVVDLPKLQQLELAIAYLELGRLYEALPATQAVQQTTPEGEPRELTANQAAESWYGRAQLEMRDAVDNYCSPNMVRQYGELRESLGLPLTEEEQADLENRLKEAEKPTKEEKGFLSGVRRAVSEYVFGKAYDTIGGRTVSDVVLGTQALVERTELLAKMAKYRMAAGSDLIIRTMTDALYEGLALGAHERRAPESVERELGYDPARWQTDELGNTSYADGTYHRTALIRGDLTLQQAAELQGQRQASVRGLEQRIRECHDQKEQEPLQVMLAALQLEIKRDPLAVEHIMPGVQGTSDARAADMFAQVVTRTIQSKGINPNLDKQRAREGEGYDVARAWGYVIEQFPAIEAVAVNIGVLSQAITALPESAGRRAISELVHHSMGKEQTEEGVVDGLNRGLATLGNALDTIRLRLNQGK